MFTKLRWKTLGNVKKKKSYDNSIYFGHTDSYYSLESVYRVIISIRFFMECYPVLSLIISVKYKSPLVTIKNMDGI